MAERKRRLTINRKAIAALLTSPEAHDFALDAATRVCARCNAWADAKPRSGDHPDDGPHFEVVTQPSKNRARYVIAPRSGFGYWLTNQFPAEFMACLEGGR